MDHGASAGKIIEGDLALRVVAVGQAGKGGQHIGHIAGFPVLADGQLLIFQVISFHQISQRNIFQTTAGHGRRFQGIETVIDHPPVGCQPLFRARQGQLPADKFAHPVNTKRVHLFQLFSQVSFSRQGDGHRAQGRVHPLVDQCLDDGFGKHGRQFQFAAMLKILQQAQDDFYRQLLACFPAVEFIRVMGKQESQVGITVANVQNHRGRKTPQAG